MFSIEVRHKFDASHQLIDSDLLVSKACARLHGHTYAVRVFISAKNLNAALMVVDFKAVKNIIDECLDHRHINSVFNSYNEYENSEPTAENIAGFLAWKISEGLRSQNQYANLDKIMLCEGYRGDEFSSWVTLDRQSYDKKN